MTTQAIVKYAAKSFTLPDTCVRVRNLLDDPRASIDDIAKVMQVDPSLSAKVLRLANSALFRFQSEIASIPKALGVIGGEAAYNISMAETANLAFKSFSSEHIDFNKFWEAAVLNGILARAIAQQKQIRGSERYFVIGILLNLSELVCATCLPDKYAEYKQQRADKLPFTSQRDIFGFTFAQCSGEILSSWSLPESLYKPLVNFHLTTESLSYFEQSLVFMSHSMAYLERGDELTKHPQMPSLVLETIGLTAEDYAMIFEFARAEAQKIASALN